MNREYVTQVSLLVLGSFILSFTAIQYALDRITRVGVGMEDESALYSNSVAAEPTGEPATYAVTAIDKSLYAKHLTTLGDPFAGCGCPSCCAVRPS